MGMESRPSCQSERHAWQQQPARSCQAASETGECCLQGNRCVAAICCCNARDASTGIGQAAVKTSHSGFQQSTCMELAMQTHCDSKSQFAPLSRLCLDSWWQLGIRALPSPAKLVLSLSLRTRASRAALPPAVGHDFLLSVGHLSAYQCSQECACACGR